MYNRPNVSLIDISDKGTPIQEITEEGIRTIDNEYEFDYIISATGYDAITGGLKQIADQFRPCTTMSQADTFGCCLFTAASCCNTDE